MRAAWTERYPECRLIVAAHGEDALRLLAMPPVPRAVILDLGLPTIDGFQVLGAMQSSPAYRQIPVVVFTQRQSEEARYAAMRLGATSFQVKPASKTGYSAFATLVKTGIEASEFPAA